MDPKFHDLGPWGDNHYGADPLGLVPEDLFRRMKQIGVRYVFGKVNRTTDKMFTEFQKIGGREMVTEVDMKRPNLLNVQGVTSMKATVGNLSATVGMVTHHCTRAQAMKLTKLRFAKSAQK